MNEWKQFNSFTVTADKSWQKKIDGIYVNVYFYQAESEPYRKGDRYEIDMQFQSDANPTINVTLFTYFEEDFELFEREAKAIIKKLS